MAQAKHVDRTWRIRFAQSLFNKRFGPDATFETCDGTGIEDRVLHSLWTPIQPLDSHAATRQLAFDRFHELNVWLRRVRWLFPRHHHLQCVVGFPLSLKPVGMQILKWGFQATSLPTLNRIDRPEDLRGPHDWGVELNNWHWGLFGNPLYSPS